jgi:hypothetical protein
VEPAHTTKWIDAARPADPALAHPSLIDTQHITDELFGFSNIPMAVWIDEAGTIVRPAEGASIEQSPMRDMEIPEGLPERLTRLLVEVKNIPDVALDYRPPSSTGPPTVPIHRTCCRPMRSWPAHNHGRRRGPRGCLHRAG